jgi:DNA-binding transcriptional ArsR family regulator
MSFTPARSVTREPAGRTEKRTIDTEGEVSELLAALEDEDSREILRLASDRPHTAAEFCEKCDLASSTGYRKVNELKEAGLLSESIRLSQSGSHTSEYSLAVRDLTIALGGGIELSLTATADESGPVSAD